MAAAKFLELVMLCIFEKRTVADYVQFAGAMPPDFGFTG